MQNNQNTIFLVLLIAIVGLLVFNTFQNTKSQQLGEKFDSLKTTLKVASDDIVETKLILSRVKDSLDGFNKQADFIRNQVQQVNIARQIENSTSGKERQSLTKELNGLNAEEDRLKAQLDSLSKN